MRVAVWLGGVAVLTTLAVPAMAQTPNREAVARVVAQQHGETVKALQEWIALPTIAAEKLNVSQGAEYMRGLALDTGFQMAKIIPTDGVPGVFATLDSGAKTTLGIYFMYDVKQFDPAEWSSPPLEGRLVDRPGEGQAMVGRGAVNQKGPEMAFLAAVKAIRASGRKLPVNLVLVAEGEEEVASIRVIGVDQDSREDSDAPVVARTVTVEVTPEQGQRLALAQQAGRLSLSLRDPNAAEDMDLPAISLNDLLMIEPPPEPVAAEVEEAPVVEAPVVRRSIVVRRAGVVSNEEF